MDLTASDVPWGALPVADQAQFVLVVHQDGRTEEVTTPDFNTTDATNDLSITAELDSLGFAASRTEMSVGGAFGNALKEMFSRSLDSTERAGFLRQAASGIYPESEGDSLTTSDELDQGGTFKVRFNTRQGRAAQLAGPVAILALPFLRAQTDVKPLVAEIRAHIPRKYPIDVAQVGAGGVGTVRFNITLPSGWRAQLPGNVSLSSPYGVLQIEYGQSGRVLSMTVRREGRKGIQPPGAVEPLITWLEQVAKAEREASAIVLQK